VVEVRRNTCAPLQAIRTTRPGSPETVGRGARSVLTTDAGSATPVAGRRSEIAVGT